MTSRTFPRMALVGLIFLAGVVYAGMALVVNNRVIHFDLQAVNTADTAKVYKLHTFTARDGFTYEDTITFTATDTSVVAWTSPKTVRRITFVTPVDTTLIDSIMIDLGTNRTGVGLNCPNIAGMTRAALIDTMVARMSAVTTLADSVDFQDSVSYIKVVAKLAQDAYEGDARFTLKAYPVGAMAETDSTFTTVNMVCDSMVAAINGTAAIADSAVAAVMGAAGGAADTAYRVTGRKGYDFLLSPGDTAQDTVVLTAAVAGTSSITDTFFLERVAGDDRSFTSLDICAVLALSTDTTHGIGDSSIGALYLYNGRDSTLFAWAAAADSSQLPCTLSFSFPDAAAADTVFKQGLYIVARVTDTFSDTSSYMIEYLLNMDYTLKGSR